MLGWIGGRVCLLAAIIDIASPCYIPGIGQGAAILWALGASPWRQELFDRHRTVSYPWNRQGTAYNKSPARALLPRPGNR